VRDVMHAGDALPHVAANALLPEALLEMTRKGRGMTAVEDDNGRLIGILTDGDLRRVLEKAIDNRITPIHQVMSANPRSIGADALAVAAVEKMQSYNINGMLVVDEDNRLIGALNMLDLLRAGVV